MNLGGTQLLMYDEAGHLVTEYGSSGSLIEETIWMDDTPVAVLHPSGSSVAVYYLHTDHLNTPRKVTRPSDNGLMWRWDPDTFGSQQPNSNPAGLGAFTYNLRFPGQYFMNESGLFANGFRTYDPTTGRYLESDPIGLAGGNYSTYGYVGANPISHVDPFGLSTLILCANPVNVEACVAAGEITAAQAQAVLNAAKITARLATIVAAASCMKDVDCEEWLDLLNQNYARLEFMESRGGQVEAEKLDHNKMVETFCTHCPTHCSRANTFGPRRIH
jgi:RHS repeat-associated protein